MPQAAPKKKRVPTYRERMDEIETLRYLILVEGYSQSDAAKHIGRSGKTVCLWIKKYSLRDEIAKAKGRQSVRALKMKDSLPVFIAWLRIHHPQLHRQMQPALQDF